jgi:hypothetical protein
VDIASSQHNTGGFLQFQKKLWFFKLRVVMWWFFGINSAAELDEVVVTMSEVKGQQNHRPSQ